jgi:hypothetical protein
LPLFKRRESKREIEFSQSDVDEMETRHDADGLIKALVYKKDDFLWSPTGEAPSEYKDHALVRQAAAKALGRIGGEKAVDGLITALKDNDINVRMQVVQALGEIGGENAVDGLVNVLNWKHWLARYPSSALTVVPELQDQHSRVRSLVASALGKIGDPRSVPALTVATQDSSVIVRQSAAEALKEMEKKIESSSPPPISTKAGASADDLRLEKEQTGANSTMSTPEKEDEEFASKLAKLSRLSDIQYNTDKAAYEKTAAEFRMIGKQLCSNGGQERMKRIACRMSTFGGRPQDCEMYWAGICGWREA